MRILFVDPDKEYWKFYDQTIKNLDPMAEIIHASLAYEASILLRSSKFDIVIIEIYLPDLRGDLIVNFNNELSYKIGMSAVLSSAEVRRKFDDFILKPFTKDELERAYYLARFNIYTLTKV